MDKGRNTLRSSAERAKWVLPALLAASALSHRAVRAASPSVWNGAGIDSLWTDAANWNGNVPVPSSTYALQFAGTANLLTINDFTAASNFGPITFNSGAGAFTLTGNAIVLDGDVTNGASSLQTINTALDLDAGVRTFMTGVTVGNSTTVGDLVVNGIISNGGITKSGGGVLTLTGNNIFTGVTTLNTGTLSVGTIGNAGAAGNLGAAAAADSNIVFNGGTLRYTGSSATTNRGFTINAGKTAVFEISANTLTLAGTSTASTGGLTKTGSGTLALTGSNTYTGTTSILAGTLKLDFSAAGAPASNILSSGDAVILNSSLATATAQASSATLLVQGNGTSAVSQSFGLLSVVGSGYSGSTAGHLVLAGGTAAAPITVSFTGMGQFLGTNSKGPVLDISKGANDTVSFGSTGIISTNGVLGGTGSNYTAITLNGTDWATLSGGTSGNVVAATYTTDVYGATNNVNVTTNNVASGSSLQANTLRFNTSADITLTASVSSNIRGILETANVGAHSVTITSVSSGSIGNTTPLTFPIIQNNTSGDMTITAPINFTANNALVKAGAGRVILGASTNNYYGVTYVDEGTLQISSNGSLGGISGVLNAAVPMVSPISVNGTLEARGGGNVRLDGSGTATGIYGRNLIIGTGGATIDVDSPTTLTISGGVNANPNNYAAVPGSGSLTKTGAGTLVLSGANNSAGGLVINAGTVQATTAGNALTGITATPLGMQLAPTFTSGVSSITVNNASTIGLAAGQLITGTNITAGTTITGVSGNTVTLSQATAGASSGSYNFYTKATTATFSSGTTTITVGNATGIQVGQLVSVNGNTATIAGNGGIALGTVVTSVNGTTIGLSLATTAGNSSGTQYSFGGINQFTVASTAGLALGNVVTGTGLQGGITGIQGNVVTQSSFNNATLNGISANYGAYDSLGIGSITINGGTLDLGGVSHTSGLVQGITLTGGVIQNGTLQGSSFDVQSGSISASLAGPGVALTKSTSGTVTLSGTNTYSGPTTINGGNLAVNGSLTSAVTVNAGGTLAPGSSIGTISMGTLSLAGTLASEIDASVNGVIGNSSAGTPVAGTSDLVNVTGTVTLGGTLSFSLLNATPGPNSNTYVLIVNDGSDAVVGTFANIVPSGGGITYAINYNYNADGGSVGNDVVITFSSVPEPGMASLLACGVMGASRRRRRRH